MAGVVKDSLDAVMGVHELVDTAVPGGYVIWRGTYAECVSKRDELEFDQIDTVEIQPYFDPSSWDAMTQQIVSGRNKRAA